LKLVLLANVFLVYRNFVEVTGVSLVILASYLTSSWR